MATRDNIASVTFWIFFLLAMGTALIAIIVFVWSNLKERTGEKTERTTIEQTTTENVFQSQPR